MTSYIGGLASGLDTASMVKQLLDIERLPIVTTDPAIARYDVETIW